MVSIAPSGLSNLQDSAADQRLLRQQYAEKFASKAEIHASQQTAAGQTVQVSASVSNTVSISGYSTRSHTFVPNGVDKYQAIQDKPPNTAAADNIVNFISAQLATDVADGATREEMESRLAAGFEGFMQGYSEAADILVGSGLLTPEVEEVIKQTYNNVLTGINALAEKYGVKSPVPEDALTSDELVVPQAPTTQSMSSSKIAAPAAKTFADIIDEVNKPLEDLETLLQSTKMSYEGFESKSFSFELRTQDGDKVTISATSQQSQRFGGQSVNYSDQYANMNARGYQMESASANAFNLSVQGELDEGELQAIGGLLNQIGQLSDSFFSGNVMEAFDMALELGFDGEEIASFSLNLKHEAYQKLENSYGSVQQMEPKQDLQGVDKATLHLKHLARFVQMLEEARLQAEDMGLDKGFIGKVAGHLGQQHYSDDERSQKIQGFMDSMLNHLGNTQPA